MQKVNITAKLDVSTMPKETGHHLSYKILIVDDEEENLRLLQLQLAASGYDRVVIAGSGTEALEKVASEKPDLVLLDVMMPVMNGYKVTQRIRNEHPDAFIPIILVSALQSPIDRVRGLEAGANDFISRPYDADELIARVEAQLALKADYEQLQPSHQLDRTEALLAQTADGVIATDGEGYIIRINPAACDLFGLDESVIGSALGELLPLGVADLLTRAQERLRPVLGEFSLRDKESDSRRVFSVSVSPVADVGYVLVIQDITPLKELEQFRLEHERSETQRVIDTLSRYMSPPLVERALNDRDFLTRRERREAVVLFTDLRGFTRLTVEHSPDRVIDLLNDFFSAMIEVVHDHEGVIFAFAGDELLVGFNVPYDQPDASHRALRTAIDMQRRFNDLRRRWTKKRMSVGMGIGISRGVVVIGSIGGPTRMDYAMVGETVNIAHRLVERAEDGQIIASSEVLKDGLPPVEGICICDLPSLYIRGRDEPQSAVVLELVPLPGSGESHDN